jgi:hypothetical protein
MLNPMRYLSLLLLGPWLIVLAWAYWAMGKTFRVSWQRKAYDVVVVLVALVAAYGSALLAYDDITIQSVGSFGRESGGIWKQVMPALYGYGAFAAVMMVGIVTRMVLRRRKRNVVAPERV